MNSPVPLPEVSVINSTVAASRGPIPVRLYTPATSQPRIPATLVWVHGGAFVSGGLDQLESHAVGEALARAGFRVITVDYTLTSPMASRFVPTMLRRAALVHYPVPVNDVVAVIEQVLSNDGEVIVGGASAGACLAAAALHRVGTNPRIRGAFFAYGLFHPELPPRSREIAQRVRGLRKYVHSPSAVKLMCRHYAGSSEALNYPDAFPGGHSLRSFPPTLMIDADHDTLRASSEQFARELAADGIIVEHHIMCDSRHAFLNRPEDPAFSTALQKVVDWATLLK
ncbi:alpha/beta hydrolase [Humidisolicoccus flavus]|uniref:alpha/beta hydrolase n=1 Tax=Humidisolicoccus flavus TaxID=3111414 RepID=UPI003246EE3B